LASPESLGRALTLASSRSGWRSPSRLFHGVSCRANGMAPFEYFGAEASRILGEYSSSGMAPSSALEPNEEWDSSVPVGSSTKHLTV